MKTKPEQSLSDFLRSRSAKSKVPARSLQFQQAADVVDAYSRQTEDLQNLCSEFGCLVGEHRLNWLRSRLERLRHLDPPSER